MGAMVYGTPGVERIDLSEITCFSGEPQDDSDAESKSQWFTRARIAAVDGEFQACREAIRQFAGRRPNYGTNLPVGSLRIDPGVRIGTITAYFRRLDLKTATLRIRYRVDRQPVQWSFFISNPSKTMVIILESCRPFERECRLSLEHNGIPIATDNSAANITL